MNFKLTKIATGMAALGLLASFSGGANAACTLNQAGIGFGAECVIINNGYDTETTDPFGYLTFTGQATSIYTLTGSQTEVGPGSTVLDSNMQSVLSTYGLTAPGYGQRRITELGDLTTGAQSFNSTNPAAFGWGLSFDYYLTGVVGASGLPSYNDGFFDLFYTSDQNAPGTQVLRLIVDDAVIAPIGGGNAGALTITGTLDFSGDAYLEGGSWTCDATCQAFFSFEGGPTFFDGQLVEVRLATTVDPAIPSGLAPTTQANSFSRQADLAGSVVFRQGEVPEPGVLALLGVGLLGAAASKRRKAKA